MELVDREELRQKPDRKDDFKLVMVLGLFSQCALLADNGLFACIEFLGKALLFLALVLEG